MSTNSCSALCTCFLHKYNTGQHRYRPGTWHGNHRGHVRSGGFESEGQCAGGKAGLIQGLFPISMRPSGLMVLFGQLQDAGAIILAKANLSELSNFRYRRFTFLIGILYVESVVSNLSTEASVCQLVGRRSGDLRSLRMSSGARSGMTGLEDTACELSSFGLEVTCTNTRRTGPGRFVIRVLLSSGSRIRPSIRRHRYQRVNSLPGDTARRLCHEADSWFDIPGWHRPDMSRV